MASTPSPPLEDQPRTPPAPRFGTYHDTWEPWASRKSSRISSQRISDRTPPPRGSHIRNPRCPQNNTDARRSSSPMPSPRKKRQPDSDSTRRVSGPLTAEGTANAAAALGLTSKKPTEQVTRASRPRASTMLPTPSKTPNRSSNGKPAPEIDSIKRNLFGTNEDADLGIGKRPAKKYSGMTLESFTAENVENPIEIFNDSQDRIPVKDDSPSNPFSGSHNYEPSKRRTARKRVAIPGEGTVTVEEAVRREDGVLHNFRGKMIWRKFAEESEAQSELEEYTGNQEARLTSSSTRSSVKPRLIWGPRKSDQALEDEEAVTDVEDVHMSDSHAEPSTPKKTPCSPAETPEAPKYAPVSPPDTRRITRSGSKSVADSTPIKKGRGRRSPFDIWQVTKERKGSPKAKRQADDVAQGQTKRTRA